MSRDFPGDPVVENPHASEFHPWSGKIPRTPEQRSPSAATTEPAHLEPVLHNSGATAVRSPRSPQLEKACCCCCCCCWVPSVVSDSVRPHRRQPTRLCCPWDAPGKNTGVGCHFLLQCMKVKSESEVAQSCPTLCDPMDCSPPGSSVHGVFQAKVLEWGAITFS